MNPSFHIGIILLSLDLRDSHGFVLGFLPKGIMHLDIVHAYWLMILSSSKL